MNQKLVWILWPSFVTAIAMEGIVFSIFDPFELTVLGIPLEEHHLAAYTIGFFIFWAFAATSSALTLFFQKPNSEVNNFCVLPSAAVKPLEDDIDARHNQ